MNIENIITERLILRKWTLDDVNAIVEGLNDFNTAKNLTANGCSKTGNEFNGWNTKADGSGTAYGNQASVKNLTTSNAATVTLYAQWKVSYSIKTDVAGTINSDGKNYRTDECTYGNRYIDSGWMSAMKGFVGSNGCYDYAFYFSFKTPGATNDVSQTLKFKWWVASTGSKISSQTYRYAITTSDGNRSSYGNTTGSVDESNQLVQGTFTWNDIMAAAGTPYYQTLTINTDKLKGGTKYYLFIWPYASGGVMALQEEKYSLSVTYKDY
jgi:hypothetical protein